MGSPEVQDETHAVSVEEARAEILRLASKYDQRVASALEGRRRRQQAVAQARGKGHGRRGRRGKIPRSRDDVVGIHRIDETADGDEGDACVAARDEVAAETLARRRFEEISGERAPRGAEGYEDATGVSLNTTSRNIGQDSTIKGSGTDDTGAGNNIIGEVLGGGAGGLEESQKEGGGEFDETTLEKERTAIIEAAEKYEVRKRVGAERRRRLKAEGKSSEGGQRKRRRRRICGDAMTKSENVFDASSETPREGLLSQPASKIEDTVPPMALLPIYQPDMPEDVGATEGDAVHVNNVEPHRPDENQGQAVLECLSNSRGIAADESMPTNEGPASGKTLTSE